MRLVIILALCIAGYFAWKNRSHIEDISRPRPVATPTPEPTPEPAASPEPTPLGRLAPSGQLYVVESFSVEHEAGVHGFPRGTRVSLVAEQGEELVVTDGEMQATNSRHFFTRDLDVVDKIRNEEAEQRREAEERRQEVLAEQRKEKERSNSEREALEFEKKTKQIEDSIARCKLDLNVLRSRISIARSERWDKGYPRDGGSRALRDGIARSLSPDAASIRELLQSEIELGRHIGELELALRKHLRGAPVN